MAYHNLYELRSVGCRFFTVYGPWGRPDMALYKFVDKISKGIPIPVYNGGNMKRDFTFVADIVRGWRRSWSGARPTVRRRSSISATTSPWRSEFIRILEAAVGKRNHPRRRSVAGEVETTFADVSLAHSILGYVPTTSLEVGVERFVRWYKSDLRKEEFSQISD